MKRSELKEIIKEALVEILPEVLELMNEQFQARDSRIDYVVEANTPIGGPLSGNEPDLDLIRSKFRSSQVSDNPYGDTTSRAPVARGPKIAPKNPKGVVDGEPFASGKGILEWYSQVGAAPAAVGEFSHSQDDMSEFMKKKFGV